jgi:hypothetical protein
MTSQKSASAFQVRNSKLFLSPSILEARFFNFVYTRRFPLLCKILTTVAFTMVMRFSLRPLVYIFFSGPFLMMTARRCCVSAWVATSHHVPQRATLPSRQAAPQLHPAFLRCRGGSSDAPAFSVQAVVSRRISSRSFSSRSRGSDVLASNSQDHLDHTSTIPSPESLQNLGGGFTPRQFGGLAYWDTSSLDKFRVIFVLGGPGAGMYGGGSYIVSSDLECGCGSQN